MAGGWSRDGAVQEQIDASIVKNATRKFHRLAAMQSLVFAYV